MGTLTGSLLEILPEATQDDHGSGEGDEGRAVANCVQGLHRHVVVILGQGTGGWGSM